MSLVADHEDGEVPAEQLLEKLLGLLNIAGDVKPGKHWLGEAMKRLGLMREKRGGKHQKMLYILNRKQAIRLRG